MTTPAAQSNPLPSPEVIIASLKQQLAEAREQLLEQDDLAFRAAELDAISARHELISKHEAEVADLQDRADAKFEKLQQRHEKELDKLSTRQEVELEQLMERHAEELRHMDEQNKEFYDVESESDEE